MSDETADRNSEDPRTEDGPTQHNSDEPESGQAHAPMKGKDIPATTNLEYIDREKGKRTTM